ncbi:MAG: tRNA adenosine(34) deaminase TadA [Gammaproteobacteria bacterium]|nr:tRNA adenosine(34) deaminase TadA [Gammaproteobacteria bacterium]
MACYVEITPEERHEYWMMRALRQAHLAQENSEVPVGAVLVDCETGGLISEAYNQPISANDPTAHAEVVVLREAARIRENYRLPRTAIYVTIEPCTMCVGAISHARVDSIIFGALEPRAGSLVSQLKLGNKSFYNHRLHVLGGILENECADIISRFFKNKRAK